MTIDVGLGWAVAVLLCSVRLGTVLVMTPILDGFTVPVTVKALLVLALSAVLVTGSNLSIENVPVSGLALFSAAATELATGALLAFGIHTAFGAVAFAGKVLDIQMGFGMANVYDPVTRTQAPLLGSVLGTLAVMMFFVTESHHVMLRGIAFSLSQVPLGTLLQPVAPELVLRQFGLTYAFGLVFAAPVIFTLFLLELGLAIVSRNMPQMNIFIIAIPIKIMVGIAMLHLVARYMEGVFTRLFNTIFTFWAAVLG
jgi:flagellar biosynthetic protein FliR